MTKTQHIQPSEKEIEAVAAMTEAIIGYVDVAIAATARTSGESNLLEIIQVVRKDLQADFHGRLSTQPITNEPASSLREAELRIGMILGLETVVEARMKQRSAKEGPCAWCGKTYLEHLDGRAPGQPVPRVGCTLLKSGFLAKKA